MDCIKKVDRSAFVAFSPEAPFMAAGTMAGAVDLSFSSSSNLEIFELDFKSNVRDLTLVGQCSSSERFNRLAWGSYGSDSDGLIAGGLVDGCIGLWNPNCCESGEIEHVGHLSKHKGPVRGLEFNVKSPNQLASGADDGTVCVWDLANPSEPSHFLKGNGSYMQGEISSISWNREFQHVLASTSYNGTTVIWDVNNKKVITDFKNIESTDIFKGLIRCSVLQWDPDNFNQIMVASDEDSSPNVKLLDIRYLQSPVRTFVGHQRGVIAMEWCPSDSLYLLTSAKDNRTICWNTKTGKIVAELPTGKSGNFDVHWYPKMPGVISASSVDGKIGIYNLEGCSRYGTEEYNLDSASLTVPKWWKRPVGASFGFGGKLVSFNKKLPEASEVFLYSLATEHSLVNRISKFEAAIENGEKTSLRGLCEKKTEETESEEEKETWGLLKIMLEEDRTAKKKLRTHLGFGLPSEEKDQTVNEPQQMPEREEESSDPTFDDAIQRSLIMGDYKNAVAQCLAANKMADALVIAHVGGTSLWESTRDTYLRMSNAPYMKVVSAMMSNDLMTLVQTRPPKSWKETLALICTFAEGDEWTSLCDALASNLMATGFTLPATLCYICAGNVDKTVDIWSSSLEKESVEKSYAECVQDLMEKTIILTLATGNKRFSTSLRKIFESYAEILASQGLLATAMKFLKILESGDFSTELSILRDRLALTAEPEDANTSASENTQPAEISLPYQKKSFPPAPIRNVQPCRTTFVPLNPPLELKKNADQYQQPTMDYHSFTRSVNPAYNAPPVPDSHQTIPSQVGPYLNSKIAQTVAPPMRPMTPIQQVAAQPAPVAPPPTVQTADTSNVPAHQKHIVATLTRLFKEISEPVGGYSRANPANKREIEGHSRKLGALFLKLNNGDVSKNVAEKLAQLCQALEKHDFSAAFQLQTLMINTEWEECNFWLPTLKRMIKGRQNER